MKLRIATDFSGIGVPEMALEALKIPHTNIFACEKDKFTRTAYLANFKPQTFYDDITTRNHSKVGPIDLYIAACAKDLMMCEGRCFLTWHNS